MAQLLHRAVAIDAHRERAMRRPSRTRPASPVRGCAGSPRRPAAGGRRFLARRRGAAGEDREAAGSTGTCALAYSPRPDAGAKQFPALWVGGAVPALGDRRAADRPGDARQDRRRACRSGSRRLVMMARHKSFGITILGLAVIRLAWRWIDRPPPPAADAALAAHGRAAEPLGAVCAAVCAAAFRLADVLGREPPGELVRPRAAARISSRPTRA